MAHHSLAGVFAAALTPLDHDHTLAADDLLALLDFLAQRGCHGALLLGTTGEGPSFSTQERLDVFRTAVRIRETHPDFRLLAGTGTPSLDETALLTAAAFDFGFDGALVLPPYYFRGAHDDGLLAWFRGVIQRAVPEDGALFGYHIPGVSGVALSVDLISRLKDAHPRQFAGLKDSSASADHARLLGERFGNELTIFVGSDRLLTLALNAGARGCITALANLISPDLRAVWDAHQAGKANPAAQARLDAARNVWKRYPPAPSLLKALIARTHPFPRWAVKPPLLPLTDAVEERAALDWKARGKMV